MDYATLKALKPSEFQDAADGYRATSNMASAAKDHIDNQVAARAREELKGEAATAALRELGELSANFHYAQTECGLVSTALNGFAYDLQAAQSKLASAVSDAQAQQCTVNPDGSVSYPAVPDRVDGKYPEGGTAHGTTDPTAQAINRQAAGFDPNPYYGAAQECADRIVTAINEATKADEKWGPKVRALKADDDLTVSKHDWADAHSDMSGVQGAAKPYLDSIGEPPKDGSPTDNAKWWKSLTPEEQTAYISMHPASVGALDGLPAEIRDEANRVGLAEKHAQVQIRLDGIPPEPTNKYTWIKAGNMPSKVPTDEWMEWHKKYGDEYEHLTASLKGMQSIENRFDSTGVNGLPEAYLLGFDAEGNGRAIIANGNPDTAAHQAVYVPGTESNLGGVSGGIDRMTTLWRQSQIAAGDSPVSTITWLGYDAPQNVVTDSPFGHYADDGAPAFTRFMDGLEASHTGDSAPHRTAIGHSYGTTLIGSAARQGELNVDDVVFAGSPGVQVGSAEEMDVLKGHVWNQEAEGDVVPDIGRFGHGGSQWGWVDGGMWITPSDDLFGANQMTTGAEQWGGRETGAAHGHSDYWEPNTSSLLNQAEVVAGNYGNVHLED